MKKILTSLTVLIIVFLMSCVFVGCNEDSYVKQMEKDGYEVVLSRMQRIMNQESYLENYTVLDFIV